MPTHAVLTEDDIVEAVMVARQWQAPLEIVGLGSKRNLGRPCVTMGTVLDVSGLCGIVSYEPDELILTAKPATTIAEINAVLGEKGQRLGFEPPQWGRLLGSDGPGSIGGAISADACGPARVRYGAARDHLLGIRAINGLGEAFKAGGKVVKNVTGFDIPKLVCGAMGTLCVLSEVTLRVFPKPPLVKTFRARGYSPTQGFSRLRKLWSLPLDATGLSFSKDTVLVRVEGEANSLAEKVALLKSVLDERTLEEVDQGEIVFAAIGEGSVFLDTPFDVWRAFVPPSEAAKVLDLVDSPLWIGDWAGSLLWLASLPGGDQLRTSVRLVGGHAQLMRASEETRERIEVFERQELPTQQLTLAVKKAFDPMGLLNPGRMWEGV